MKTSRMRRWFRPSAEVLESRDAPALFGPIDRSFTVGTNPFAVVAADFNGDGHLDLATADSGSSTGTILLGNGSGAFSSAGTFPTGTSPRALTAVDFNGDGKVDLAVANFNGSSVAILIGTGAGTFDPVPVFLIPTGFNPTDVAAADFNGDGRQDLAVSNFSDSSATILLGQGDGTFTSSTIAAGSGPQALAVADFNGDGLPDLAFADLGDDTVTVVLGNGDGTFTSAGTPIAVGIFPFSLAVGDFNGDGRSDLVVANLSSGDVTPLLGNGAGGFNVGTAVTSGNGPTDVKVGDFNGDGRLDIVTADLTGGEASLFLGLGNGDFNPDRTSISTGANPVGLAAGDFNGDGRLDLAVANSAGANVSVSLNHGGTTTTVSSSVAQAVYGQAITFTATVTTDSGAPVDGFLAFYSDGQLLTVSSISGAGTAGLILPASNPLAAGAHVITARFTSDTFVASTSAPLVETVAQAATTTTVTGPAMTPSGKSITLTAVITGPTTPTGSVTFRDGGTVLGIAALANGVATLDATFATSGPHAITAQYSGDDNDLGSTSAVTTVLVQGSAEKIVAGSGIGGMPVVKVYNADGSLQRSIQAFGPSFRGGVRVATGDVNGDGVDDIIVAPGPGAAPHVRVFDGLTGGEIRAFTAYGIGFTSGLFVAAGDVDGDGKADIVVGPGRGSKPVRVFSGATSALLFQLPAYKASFAGGVRVAAGDVNGDGKADIVVGAGPGAALPVRVFDATGTHAELFHFTPFEPKYAGGVFVATGDVDGDKRADVIVGSGGGRAASVTVVSGQTRGVLGTFPAFAPPSSGGVRVAAGDVNGDGLADIIVAPGSGAGPLVQMLSGKDGTEVHSFFAFDPSFNGGVYVG